MVAMTTWCSGVVVITTWCDYNGNLVLCGCPGSLV